MKSFYEVDSHTFFNNILNKVKNHILQEPENVIMSIDENEYKKRIYDKYALEKLNLNATREKIDAPEKRYSNVPDGFGGWQNRLVNVYTIKFIFSGSPELFSVLPDHYTMTTAEIEVNSDHTVSFEVIYSGNDQKEFENILNQMYRDAFTNLPNTNSLVDKWNTDIESIIVSTIQQRKATIKSSNDFLNSINS